MPYEPHPGVIVKEILSIHLNGDSLIVQVRGANEETVWRFEEAGWSWNPETSEETPE